MADTTKMNVVDEVFKLPISITANGTVTKVLNTQDTYVDKNIKVEITTPDATYEVKDKGAGANGEITATVSTTDDTYTSDTETDYAIVIAADAHVNPVTVGVENAGFAAATDEKTVAAKDATKDTKTIYVKAGELGEIGDGSSIATSSSVKLTEANASATGFVIKTNSESSVGVTTAGWVDPAKNVAVDTKAESYYTVQAASLSNAEANADKFTEVTAPVLTEDGYLFINEGYIADTKISLATLVPDGSTLGAVTDASDYMYNTIKAYDNDGKLVTGTMGNATLSAITANDASATVGTVAVAANADESAFKVTGSKAISGNTSVAVATRGLAETTLSQTGVISGTAEVDATIAKIGLGVTIDDNDVEVTPVIAKEDATTAKSGDITTTAPTSGHYVAVSTAAMEETVTVAPKVSTEGYGTTDVYNATGANVKAGAAASGTYYVPITEGGHSIVANESEVTKATATVSTAVVTKAGGTVAGVLAAAPDTGDYLTIDGTAAVTNGSVKTSSTCTVTEGYVTAESKTTTITEAVEVTPTAAATKYIKIYDGSFIDA